MSATNDEIQVFSESLSSSDDSNLSSDSTDSSDLLDACFDGEVNNVTGFKANILSSLNFKPLKEPNISAKKNFPESILNQGTLRILLDFIFKMHK